MENKRRAALLPRLLTDELGLDDDDDHPPAAQVNRQEGSPPAPPATRRCRMHLPRSSRAQLQGRVHQLQGRVAATLICTEERARGGPSWPGAAGVGSDRGTWCRYSQCDCQPEVQLRDDQSTTLPLDKRERVSRED
jgi:hypothetical protein